MGYDARQLLPRAFRFNPSVDARVDSPVGVAPAPERAHRNHRPKGFVGCTARRRVPARRVRCSPLVGFVRCGW